MEKVKFFFAVLGIGITIGIIITVVLLFITKATPKKVTIGGV